MSKAPEPVQLNHPAFEDTTVTVQPDEVDNWVAAGWLAPKVAKGD